MGAAAGCRWYLQTLTDRKGERKRKEKGKEITTVVGVEGGADMAQALGRGEALRPGP